MRSAPRPPAANRSPLSAPLAVGAALLLALTLALIEVGVLEYTYARLGIGHRVFASLLLLSLLGSLVNVPLATLPAGPADSPGEAPPGGTPGARRTVLAVNVGGAVVPAALSIYLVLANHLLLPGVMAIATAAGVSHVLARPVPGVGIAVPVLVPPIAAAALGVIFAPHSPAPLAYAAGSLGTLIGADLANLGRLRELGAPVVSIGGAGTFDGVFLTGIIAVLLA